MVGNVGCLDVVYGKEVGFRSRLLCHESSGRAENHRADKQYHSLILKRDVSKVDRWLT